MLVVATTTPELFVLRTAFVSPVNPKLVVVALVVVALLTVIPPVHVEDAEVFTPPKVSSRDIVPVVVIVPPVTPLLVATDETVALEVLQVEQVSASVPPRLIVPAPPNGEAVVTMIEEFWRAVFGRSREDDAAVTSSPALFVYMNWFAAQGVVVELSVIVFVVFTKDHLKVRAASEHYEYDN